jgi:hypothetical protein
LNQQCIERQIDIEKLKKKFKFCSLHLTKILRSSIRLRAIGYMSILASVDESVNTVEEFDDWNGFMIISSWCI